MENIGEPQVVLQISITITDNGQLNVQTNQPGNLILLLGILEAAKDAARKMHEKVQNQLVQPSGVIPGIHV